jgi:CubicO group peptidase (beta-lactamase class C family)
MGRKVFGRVLGVVVVAALMCAPAIAKSNPLQPTGAPWPTKDWAAPKLPSGVDAVALDVSLDRAFRDTHPQMGETRALLVVHGGRLAVERYGAGYSAQTRHVSWSMAKSITQALVGVAVREGKLEIDQPMGNSFWPAGDPRGAISWRHWLQMVDGTASREIGAQSPTKSDAALMLYGPGRLNNAAYAASLPVVHKPGEHWNYATTSTLLVSDALTSRIAGPALSPAARRQAMSIWMRDGLFDRIGMASAQPEFDPTGSFVGSSLVYATPRDFAKFGLLYLRDGVWEGERVLPEGWVDFATTPPPAAKNSDTYGAGWWLTPPEGTGKPYRSLVLGADMKGAYSAQGYQGQVILIVPRKDLVIVRLGLFGDGRSNWDALGDWLAEVAGHFPDTAPNKVAATADRAAAAKK